MIQSIKFPLYLRATVLIIGISLFVYVIYIGQSILVPLAYSVMISILLTPLVIFLEKRKVNRVLAIAVSVILAIFFSLALIYFIASQLSMFDKALPMMRQKLNGLQFQLSQWIAIHFNLSIQRIDAWFSSMRLDMINNGNAVLGKTIIDLSSFLVGLVAIPVYVFMLLYYEPLLLAFARKLFSKEHHEKLRDVMFLTRKIVQSYLSGLLIEAVIIAALNAIALLMIGIDYALLLGILGALLNMIPFIGGIVAVAIPMIIAFLTKDSIYYPILVLLAYMFIQFIDNHYITPKIVASKVRINALVALIVVFIGNALWGISGMFLAIPITGILKVVFEHTETMKPWALLLGDTMPVRGRYVIGIPRRKRKIPKTERMS